jgi:formamidopyrimidine-DNA glycosylase
MPELPDIEVYLACMRPRVVGKMLERIRLINPFLLRSIEPSPADVERKPVTNLRRIGKRIVFEFDGELSLVLHLMIAGRLHWKPVGAKPPGKIGLATFDFENGTLTLTEAGSKRRASLYIVRGEVELAQHDPGGVEPLSASLEQFAKVLQEENHTLKRSLTDPRFFSGIGNSYSDEILHRARLSPLALSQRLGEKEVKRLYEAVQTTLIDWRDRLLKDAGDGFPEKVTAFRAGMAVHGRFGEPCPDCGTAVQRIQYADNETNYCPRCQTGGRLLADRSLSRLLKDDWPRTIEELEEQRGR